MSNVLRAAAKVIMAMGTKVRLEDKTIYNIGVSSVSSQLILNSAGQLSTVGLTGTTQDPDEWITLKRSGVGSGYEARLTVVSGATPTGSATGTWLPLSSTLSWTVTNGGSPGSIVTSTCTLEVRRTTQGDVQATSSITFTAELIGL